VTTLSGTSPLDVSDLLDDETVESLAPPRTLLAVVAHARRVTSVAREEFANALAAIGDHEQVLVVRTCHRVEVYVALRGADGEVVALPDAPLGARTLTDADAARHLISVACGLQSAVLGEDQVMHQIREAHADRRAAGPLDPTLDRLVQVALRAGRKAHGMFGPERRSLADMALDEIEARSGGVEGREVLVVGAGSMGVLAARGAVRRGAKVVVVNRTDAKAEALAADSFGRSVAWGADDTIGAVAGVIVALGGAWTPGAADEAALLSGTATVVDLSSPPATPAALADGLGHRFVGVDDLAWAADGRLPEGLHDQLEEVVRESGTDYCRWLRSRGAHPTLQEMSDTVEARRQSELDRLMRRLPDLDEHERELIDQMTHRLVASILHGPRTALRVDLTGDLDRAARTLFGL
jgi:glutamyl-tRNA reductase